MELVEHLSGSYVGSVLVGLGTLLVLLLLRPCFVSTKTEVLVVGSSVLFGYLTALKVAAGGFPHLLHAGRKKYNLQPFQIPALRAWTVYLPSKYLQEVRKAPETVLSARAELNDLFAVEYTMARSVTTDYFHADIARAQLPSKLGSVFPAIYDEIFAAFNDEIGELPDDEYEPVPAYSVIAHVICRASNRLFIGLPLCRNKEFALISLNFAGTVVDAGMLISMFPEFLRPFLATFLSKAPTTTKGFEKFLLPIIEERKRLMADYGEHWDEKPNDFLQWMLDASLGTKRSSRDLALRMLPLNFAAIRTTAESFTHALFDLAANPQYIVPLREEVELAVKEHGWTKDALNAMLKVDSFIKESMRIGGIEAASVKRKVLQTFRFSDGTTVRPGQHIAMNMWAIHHDPSLYSDPETFDPFRFSRKAGDGGNSVTAGLGTTTSDFLFWGYGPHSCAGRAFAALEMKAMLAHITVYYDVRFEEDGVRPVDTWVNSARVANRSARVLFRGRRAGSL